MKNVETRATIAHRLHYGVGEIPNANQASPVVDRSKWHRQTAINPAHDLAEISPCAWAIYERRPQNGNRQARLRRKVTEGYLGRKLRSPIRVFWRRMLERTQRPPRRRSLRNSLNATHEYEVADTRPHRDLGNIAGQLGVGFRVSVLKACFALADPVCPGGQVDDSYGTGKASAEGRHVG
jgi:hypothetical protein